MKLNTVLFNSATLAFVGLPVMTIAAIPAIAESNISHLKDYALLRRYHKGRPATTLKEWRAQVEAAIVRVTNVKVDRTDDGLDITLETDGKPLTIDASKFKAEGNALIADIPNTVLALPESKSFEALNPTTDIATIRITQQDANQIRISVIGTQAVPKTEITLKANGLAYSLAPDADDPEEEVIVTGAGLGRYSAPNASTATRTNTPILDVPQSIQVIPRKVLEDQNAVELRDVAKNVSGVALESSAFTSFPTQFRSRGFLLSPNNGNVFINGIRNRVRFQNDLANVEQVEFLKGPASVLYGQSEPGGIINYVTKNPLEDPFYGAQLTLGNYSHYRAAIDFTGSINDEKTVLYRLNTAYLNTGSFVDFIDIERAFVAPTISFQISDKTSLILESEHQSNSVPDYDGIPAVGSVLPNPNGRIPRSRNIDDPLLKRQNYYSTMAGYRFQHEFSENWKLRNAFRIELWRTDEGIVSPVLLPDNRTISRTAFLGQSFARYYTVQTDLVGTIKTGNIKQDLLFGVEWFHGSQSVYRTTARLPNLNLFNPVYQRPDIPFRTVAIDQFSREAFVGIYAQDLISFGEQFKVLLGGRFDISLQSLQNDVLRRTFESDDTAFSPRVGLVYQPIKEVSLYAGWTRSFIPVSAASLSASGSTFEPSTGEQFEVGVKTELFNRKLTSTLAAYQIKRKNILVPDPANPVFNIQIGEQESKGIEFDLGGEVLPGLNLIATYAFTDSEFTKDSRPAFRGTTPNNVPRHSASLWANYEFQTNALKGFGIGVGVFFVGDRFGDLANTFELPSYVRTDLALYYRQKKWHVGLNIKNLFNVDFFEAARDRNAVFPGEPITVQGTVSVNF
ncbi:MAG: TonB-dependent siderophore receptor [Leptolyngbyaceae cyanobacterium bins.302]|nr:TonB-dependent siderophore receptor [Leptolyngbyaceae cyanobacterium bins.302]